MWSLFPVVKSGGKYKKVGVYKIIFYDPHKLIKSMRLLKS